MLSTKFLCNYSKPESLQLEQITHGMLIITLQDQKK